jgi:NADPH2 dehydrogenase
MKLLESCPIGTIEIRNRVVMPPMCMYTATGGYVNDFHIAHYLTRSLAGVGLIIVEATGIEPNGQISQNDLGIWDEAHLDGLSRLAEAIKRFGAAAAIQLNHAGRKNETLGIPSIAPSEGAFSEKYKNPLAMSKADIEVCVEKFARAAARAHKAGFQLIELHGAHGYLIHQFLSPVSNRRTDEYGGSHENRARFLRQVIAAVKAVLPANFPLIVRLSAVDFLADGIQIEDTVRTVKSIEKDVDAFHISAGGASADVSRVVTYPGYMLGYSEAVKKAVNKPVIAVGLIKGLDLAESIVQNHQADFVAFGRELLRNPFLLTAALIAEKGNGFLPAGYKRAF